MPDLSGKACSFFSLGASGQLSVIDHSCHWGNTGIGYQTVKQLLLKNAKVYLAARSEEKAAAAIQKLEEETKKTALFIQLDLADLPSVRKAAETFLAQEQKLDILFNNGGVMVSPPEMLTAQNFDLQFGTNVIGHYFLTDLLVCAPYQSINLPLITFSERSSPHSRRLINTSSMGHQFAPSTGIEFFCDRKLYGESKLGNILVSNYFAKNHSDILVSCSVHPGGIRTELQRHFASWQQVIGKMFLYPAPMGAHTQLWAGTVATPAQITGQYVVPWGQVGKPDKRALNTKLEEEVVAYIKEQVKDF
ncbi:NAD-P-binding protein [Mycena sp. CBHHK59/15]|nr:NAD-P-binding protein [Mycena sp. CBHHK59/15]